MKDTKCENCPFKKMGFDECPNYIETLWYQEGEPQPVIVKDCAPRRTLLMLQELYNRCYGMQCQISQAEGELNKNRAVVSILVDALKNHSETMNALDSNKTKLLKHLEKMSHDNPV